MSTVTRKRDLKADSKGRYRPRVGYHHQTGALVRFNLGTDKRAAELRYLTIQNLYADNCKVNGRNCWSVLALSMAEAVAKGEQVTISPLDDSYDDPELEYAQMVEVFQKNYPSVPIVPKSEPLYKKSLDRNEDYVQQRIAQLTAELDDLGALVGSKAKVPAKLITGTLHEALDAYKANIEKTGERLPCGTLKGHQAKRVERTGDFQEHHADCPLYSLDFDKCEELVGYWRNRPKTKRGKQCSIDHAKHMMGELYRFFGWLDATNKFAWVKPRGLDTIKRRVAKLDHEKKLSARRKMTYTVEQLKLINKHAGPLDRLMLYVGLNCAMGAAELGRLTAEDVLIRHKHEHANYLQFESSKADSFVRFIRPKSLVFGEWHLWPETVEMLEWAIDRAKGLKSKVLFCTKEGKPMFVEAAKNQQTQFANRWLDLIKRVQRAEGADFPSLPFGTLRDTLPSIMRHKYGGELASLVVAHGNPHRADSLLECYSDRPFGRLHEALRELHETYEPVFDATDAPFRERKTGPAKGTKRKPR